MRQKILYMVIYFSLSTFRTCMKFDEVIFIYAELSKIRGDKLSSTYLQYIIQ